MRLIYHAYTPDTYVSGQISGCISGTDPRIPPARGIPDAHAAHGHSSRDATLHADTARGSPNEQGSERRGPSDRAAERHSGALALRGSMQPGTCARSRAPPPGQRAHKCAPAWPRLSAPLWGRGSDSSATTIWNDRTTARRAKGPDNEGHLEDGQDGGGRDGNDRDGGGQDGGGLDGDRQGEDRGDGGSHRLLACRTRHRRVEADTQQARWADSALAGETVLGADHLQFVAARSCWSC
jgi:hypothetical protein